MEILCYAPFEIIQYHESAVKEVFRMKKGYDFPCPLKECEYYNLLQDIEDEFGEEYICSVMCSLIEQEMQFNIKRTFLGQWSDVFRKVKDLQERVRRVFTNEREFYNYVLSFVSDNDKKKVKRAKYVLYALYAGIKNEGVNVLDK